VTLALLTIATAWPHHASADGPRRLRAATPDAQDVIDMAERLSPTAARLSAQLDCTDVIVYVQLTAVPSVRAVTVFVTAASGSRYLRIQISAGLPMWERAQLLGHELQHSLEIAESRDVDSEEALAALYRRIGYSHEGPNRFETTAARDIEAMVRGELLRARGQ